MDFILTCIYMFLSFVRIIELTPELQPFRLMLILGLVCPLIALFTRMNMPRSKRASLRQPQFLMIWVFVLMVVYNAVRHLYFDEAWNDLIALQPILGAFVMLVVSLTTIKRIKIMAALLVLCCIIMAAQGMAGMFYDWHRKIFVLEWEPPDDDPDRLPPWVEDPTLPPDLPRMRSMGFLEDPNDLAQTLAISLPFLGLLWKKKRYFVNLFVVVPIASFLIYGMVLTRSRGGFVALGVMFLLALRERLGKVKAGILTALLIMAMVAVNVTGGRAMRDESSDARIEAWASGILMLRQHPFLGIGFGNFAEEHGGLTAHNSFVLCFSEMGLIGYFVWMSMIVCSFIELSRIMKIPGEEPLAQDLRRLASATRLSFSVFLTAAFFLSRSYILTLFMLIAISLSLTDIAQRAYPQYRLVSSRYWGKRTLVWQVISIALVWIAVKANGAG